MVFPPWNLFWDLGVISDPPRVVQFLIPESHQFRCVEPASENVSVRGRGLGGQGVLEVSFLLSVCSSIHLFAYPAENRWAEPICFLSL